MTPMQFLEQIFPSLARPRPVRRGPRFYIVNGIGEVVSESVCPRGQEWAMRELAKTPALTFEQRRKAKFEWLEKRCELGRRRLATR